MFYSGVVLIGWPPLERVTLPAAVLVGLRPRDVIMAPYIPAGVPSGCQYDIASTKAAFVRQYDTIRAPGYISAAVCRVMILICRIASQFGDCPFSPPFQFFRYNL